MNNRWATVAVAAGSVAMSIVVSACGSESGATASPETATSVTTTTASAPLPTTALPATPPSTTAVPTTTVPTTTVPTTTDPALPPAPQTTYAPLDGAYYFSSPDGQFQCGIVTLTSRTEAGCQGTTAPVPPRPESCMISWGNGIRVTNDGAAEFMCAGGAVYTSGGETIDPPLAVGQQIVGDGFTCTSAVDGISCVNDDTGHGFRIAPDSNETF